VLGANGAGKTTVLRTISGVLSPDRGYIRFEGRDIRGTSPDRVMRLGICHVPEGREVFPLLTVRENLIMGAYSRHDREVSRDIDLCYEYFPILKERESQRAGLLSGGQQQMLTLARALAGEFKVLMLDEFSLGLAPIIVRRLLSLLREAVAEQNFGVLLVEQHVASALSFSDRAIVLRQGEIVLEGDSDQLRSRTDEIARAYL